MESRLHAEVIVEPLLANAASHDDTSDHQPFEPVAAAPEIRRRNAVQTNLRRLLDRDSAYYQSRGRWRVQHVRRSTTRYYHHQGEEDGAGGIEPTRTAFSKQFWDEWFHLLAYQRTATLLLILISVYTAIVVYFAAVFYVLSKYGEKKEIHEDGSISILPFCDLDIHSHMEALYFSLSTLATIGYGVSDYYFGGCWSPLLLVLMEVCCGICFDAVATSLLFLRVSRGHKRGKTVLFSNKAVVRRVQGEPVLMFRVVELRRHQLHGASIRAFCVRHERHVRSPTTHHFSSSPIVETNASTSPLIPSSVSMETVHFVTRPMNLSTGNASSEKCVSILMSLPQVLIHRLDSISPLLPPSPLWYDRNGHAHPSGGTAPNEQHSLPNIEQFLLDREAEMVVVLEGTDELTGAASQTRHSYSVRDLVWDHSFVPCVYPFLDVDAGSSDGGAEDISSRDVSRGTWFNPFRRRGVRLQARPSQGATPVCVVDFARFHDTEPAPVDCETCPYMTE
jgi:Inward rectifier potassium channel transmembrane domain/Inward rectifier potassium channel C-terminal domain